MEDAQESTKKKFNFGRLVSSISITLVIVIFVAIVGFLFYRYQKIASELSQIKKDPSVLQQASRDAEKKLIEDVGKIFSLPAGEVPTVATVSNLEKLRDQPFFANAKVGDKVIIYTTAQKAILYRPDTKQIIEVMPINPPEAPAIPSQTIEPTLPAVPVSSPSSNF